MLAISSSVKLFAGMMPEAPRRFLAPGSLIDSYKYASSAVTTVPSLSVTWESAKPIHFGPTRPLPSSPWQLAQPAEIEISRPAAASGDRSNGALVEPDEQAPSVSSAVTVARPENLNKCLDCTFKDYQCLQVEFAIVVKKQW